MKIIDHFMIAGSDLDAMAASFVEKTGIDTVAGGSHPDLGTRNRLLATRSSVYLELIAPDPAVRAHNEMRDAMAAMDHDRLHRIIARCSGGDFPALAQAYRDEGITTEVRELQRITDNGDVLKWKLMIPLEPNPLGVFAPLFIDWLDTPHPNKRLPATSCEIIGYQAGHPDTKRIAHLWASLGFDFPLEPCDAPFLKVTLQTPKGRVEFRSV